MHVLSFTVCHESYAAVTKLISNIVKAATTYGLGGVKQVGSWK